ncbi:MAG: hypothetical protein O7I42_01985, partial [Alphaproteobacteria bacterium]|nr:hypothetical protein [Alphaproteobacteria bacterium]
ISTSGAIDTDPPLVANGRAIGTSTARARRPLIVGVLSGMGNLIASGGARAGGKTQRAYQNFRLSCHLALRRYFREGGYQK